LLHPTIEKAFRTKKTVSLMGDKMSSFPDIVIQIIIVMSILFKFLKFLTIEILSLLKIFEI